MRSLLAHTFLQTALAASTCGFLLTIPKQISLAPEKLVLEGLSS